MILGKFARPDWRKIARRVALGLVALVALYEILANLLLSSGAIAHLVSERPEKLRLAYAHATTLLPGHVHVEGFELRGRDPHVEWQLHIDAVDADLSLLALLGRRFHTGKVVATGVTFRVRFRLEPDDVNADRVARMPPIDGFAATPLVGVPPEPSDAKPSSWVVDIQGVDARAVREVWIDAYRVAGELHAMGGFTLGGRHLEVVPASVDVSATALTTGDDVIAADVTGRIEARMRAVDLGAVQGVAVLRYLTMRSVLRGKVGGVGFIRHFLHDDSVALSGGAGTFENDVRVADGVVEKGSTSRIELEPATALIAGRTLATRARIDVTTGADDGGNWGQLAVDLADATLTEPKAKAPAALCPSFAARARVQQLDLTELPKDFAYSWETARVDLADLRVVDGALPPDSPFHIERGAATMSTRGHGSLLGASAEVSLESNAVMRVWGARVASGTRATIPLKVSFVGRTLDLAGADLALTDPALPGWSGKVKLVAATIHFDPLTLRLSAQATAQDGRPFVAYYAAMQGTSAVARTVLGILPDPLLASMTASLHGEVRLAASKGAVDLDGLDVQGASSRLRGMLKKRGGRMEGGILVEGGPAALGISFEGDNTRVILLDAPKWFEANVAPRER